MRDLSSVPRKRTALSPAPYITIRRLPGEPLWRGFWRIFSPAPGAAGQRAWGRGVARAAEPLVLTTRWVGREWKAEKVGAPASITGLPLSPTRSSPMVPAAGALLWALLLSLGPPAAAGAQGLTSPGTQPVSFRMGGTMTRKYRTTPRTSVPPKRRVIMEDDEDDVVANADRLAGPAAAELLASTVSTDISRLRSWEQDGDGSLEEGVMINAQKNNSNLEVASTISSTTKKLTSRFAANIQDPEYRLTTSLPSSTWRSTEDPDHPTLLHTSLTRWSTAGSTPRPRPSTTAMPPPEDLRLVLMPWGPWHCHCKSGTMSRTRAGRLQGLSGRLRVGALSQIRTEHRPCTYHQCRCDRHLEECPLDSGLCSDASCSSQTSTTTTTTTTTTIAPLGTRLRPSPLHLISPSPALVFWRQVRDGLEDIWNSLSSVFTKMQPVSVW